MRYERSFKLSRYSVTIFLRTEAQILSALTVEWDPMPGPRTLNNALLREYKIKRNAAITALLAEAGVIGRVAVVDAIP